MESHIKKDLSEKRQFFVYFFHDYPMGSHGKKVFSDTKKSFFGHSSPLSRHASRHGCLAVHFAGPRRSEYCPFHAAERSGCRRINPCRQGTVRLGKGCRGGALVCAVHRARSQASLPSCPIRPRHFGHRKNTETQVHYGAGRKEGGRGCLC